MERVKEEMSATAVVTGGTNALPRSLQEGLNRSQIPALDGLRAIAAFLVVISHTGFMWLPGNLGVLAFFVLSGFLITWLLLKEDAKHGNVSLKLFYARRSLRIFPAFYVYWALIVGSRLLLERPINWPQAWASFLYVNNYYQAIFGDPNTSLSHTWSLGIEEQFYLFWPLAFVSMRHNSVRMAKALVAAIGIVWVYRIVLQLGGVSQAYLYEALECRADHLAIGCVLAIVLKNGCLANIWKFLCSRAVLGWVSAGVLAASSVLYMRFGTPYRDTVGFIVEPLAVAIFIAQTIALSTASASWRWLNAAWIRYLGRISYSTYLYQQIVPNYVERLHAPPLIELALVIAIVVGLATASYFLVERPFLRMKGRIAVRQDQPAI